MHTVAWVLAGLFVTLSVPTALWAIANHLKNWNQPELQVSKPPYPPFFRSTKEKLIESGSCHAHCFFSLRSKLQRSP